MSMRKRPLFAVPYCLTADEQLLIGVPTATKEKGFREVLDTFQ